MAGIVSEDHGQSDYLHAGDYLSRLLLHRIVHIKGYGMDQHDRIVGVIFLEDRNINLEMVRAGLAQVCCEDIPKGLNLEPYRKAEEEARKDRRGIWAVKN